MSCGSCQVNSLIRSHSFSHSLSATMAPTNKLSRSQSTNPANQASDTSAMIPNSDCGQIFDQYRQECKQLLHSTKQNPEQYVSLLERIVEDLLEQNEFLTYNIAEIQEESAKRVSEMNNKLQASAARTEEVMLALESHELSLKSFVSEHCCNCCSCEQRLTQFRLCHGDQCVPNHQRHPCLTFDPSWIGKSVDRFACTGINSNCVHTVSNQTKFTSLVESIDVRFRALEAENEEVKRENDLIRELNSLLSCRKVTPDHSRRQSYRRSEPESRTLSSDECLYFDGVPPKLTAEDFGDDLLAFLSNTSKSDRLFPGYLACGRNRDSLDSLDGSRTDSLNDRLDSGCSTDVIPSQTDLHSLALSDCEEESFEDVIKHTVVGVELPPASPKQCHDLLVGGDYDDTAALRNRLYLAERLVPKLYSTLFYYLTQRNMLLKQFQAESKARKFCKQELSSLTDCLVFSLKGIEMNAKAVKKKQEEIPLVT